MTGLKKEANSIEFQARDFALLRGLFESRVMTVAHISAIYFEGKSHYAIKRLRKLKSAGIFEASPVISRFLSTIGAPEAKNSL